MPRVDGAILLECPPAAALLLFDNGDWGDFGPPVGHPSFGRDLRRAAIL